MICFKNSYLKLLWILFAFIPFVFSDSSDNIVQILIKRPVNVVSKEFVSFAIDPINLFEIRDKSSVTIIASTFSPAYLKITGPSTNKLVLDNKTYPIPKNELRFQSTQWSAMDNWIRSVNLKPIFTLPYNEFTWKPKHIFPILGAAEEAGIKDCIWQLGTNFNITDTINYVDDLATLGTMLSAFKGNKWSLIGSDMSIDSQVPQATLYSELASHIVEANVWKQPYYHMSIDQTDYNNFMKDPIVRNLQQVDRPMWLTVPDQKRTVKSEICTEQCVINGLHWAQTLGAAAQNGFKVIFKTITENDILYPSLSYYIALIHKKVMGDKVFDSRVINGRDKANAYFYTHCSRNISSSFTVMGINFGDTKIKAITKLPSKYTGSEVMQYILSVDKYGIIHINADPINVGSTIEPVMKVKRPSRPTSFSLPARSVGFWIFPSANIKECIDLSMAENDMIIDTNVNLQKNQNSENQSTTTPSLKRPLIELRPKTASDLLLQELVVETVKRQMKQHGSHLNLPSTTIINKATSNKRKKRETYQKIINNIDMNNQFIDSIKSVKRTKNMLDLINAEKDLIAEKKTKSLLLPFKLAKLKILSNRLLKKTNRPKRQLMSKFFEKLDFMNPTKKIDLPPLFKLGPLAPLTNVDAATKSKTIDGTDSLNKKDNDFIEDIFKSRENKDLPNGDIYFEVGGEQSNDYVAYTSDDLKNLKRVEKVNQLNNNKNINNNNEPSAFLEEDEDLAVEKLPGKFLDSYHGDDESRTIAQQPDQNNDDELYQSDQHIGSSLSVPVKNEMSFGLNVPTANIKTIVKEQEPNWQENQKNLKKAKESLQSMYFNDQDIDLLLPKSDQMVHSSLSDDIDGGTVSLSSSLPSQQQQHQPENSFLDTVRNKRSINPNFNDEIQRKIDHIEISDTSDESSSDQLLKIKTAFNPNYFSRLNMLKKITRLVANLDQMDNKTYLNNINKLTDEIKDMENILINNNKKQKDQRKIELFQPNGSYQRSIESMKKKCKVLSMSLEQQCLQNNDSDQIPFLQRKTKRDTINNMNKNKFKKSTSEMVKKNYNKKMTISRNRRSLMNDNHDNLSWEQDYLQSNMIHQEFNGDQNLNNVVPVVYERKYNNNLIYDRLHKKPLTTSITTTTNNNNNNKNDDNNKMWPTKKDEQNCSTKSSEDKQMAINKQSNIDSNGGGIGTDGGSGSSNCNNNNNNNEQNIDQFIGDNNNNNNDENYRQPRFMQSFTKTVTTLMEAMNRHVSDWWNMMS